MTLRSYKYTIMDFNQMNLLYKPNRLLLDYSITFIMRKMENVYKGFHNDT